MQTVSQIHRFCFFLCIVVLILSYEKVNIHCCDEARRKILYVHFGHISEMSSHVGRNIKFHIQFVIFLCLNEHEWVFMEVFVSNLQAILRRKLSSRDPRVLKSHKVAYWKGGIFLWRTTTVLFLSHNFIIMKQDHFLQNNQPK